MDGYDMDGIMFDSCNQVRSKIRAYLRKGNTITQFLSDIGGINSNSYRRFMAMGEPMQGSENGMYPAAYHFFEKQRVANGRPKGKVRQRNEANHMAYMERCRVDQIREERLSKKRTTAPASL